MLIIKCRKQPAFADNCWPAIGSQVAKTNCNSTTINFTLSSRWKRQQKEKKLLNLEKRERKAWLTHCETSETMRSHRIYVFTTIKDLFSVDTVNYTFMALSSVEESFHFFILDACRIIVCVLWKSGVLFVLTLIVELIVWEICLFGWRSIRECRWSCVVFWRAEWESVENNELF
jgi:hypothetical protein